MPGGLHTVKVCCAGVSAVEIPLPDAEVRRALLQLYTPRLHLSPEEATEIVAGTEGATASLFAELSRRAELLAASTDTGPTGMTHVRAALAELAATRDRVAANVPASVPPHGRPGPR
jgi:hypothetical protein